MDKKYGIFYNKQFNTLMVALTPDSNTSKPEQRDDLIIIKNDKDEIVGINILKPQLGFNLDQTFYSEHPKVVEYVETKVKPVLPLTQQPQFIISKVVTVTPVPNTHLTLCQIDTRSEKLIEVICGASNVKPGMYVVFASAGAWMPSSQVVSADKIYGHETAGMLCSAKELFLTNTIFNQAGIIELPKSYWDHVGESFWKEYYRLNA